MVRSVFHPTLRATEGFVSSVFKLVDPELSVPDYTTICKRSRCLKVNLSGNANGPLHAVLDSTGLKVFGEGEWSDWSSRPSDSDAFTGSRRKCVCMAMPGVAAGGSCIRAWTLRLMRYRPEI